MRTVPLIVGSHKLFLGLRDAVDLARRLRHALDCRARFVDLVVCPSLLNLAQVAAVLDGAAVAVAAQNVDQETHGAFTGQVSLQELLALNVRHVVVGHCEVRLNHREDCPQLLRKIAWCLRCGVAPIVCVSGDDVEAFEGATVERAVPRLLARALADGAAEASAVIAYEPPPALAAGAEPSMAQANEAVRAIRDDVQRVLGSDAGAVRIVYGGGVTDSNIATLAASLDVDGFMVGRASVDLDAFLRIVDVVQTAAFAGVPATSTPQPRDEW